MAGDGFSADRSKAGEGVTRGRGRREAPGSTAACGSAPRFAYLVA